MSTSIQSFRKQIIDAVRFTKVTRPTAQLHLLYLPEGADPLALSHDTRRSTVTVGPSPGKRAIALDKENLPRLITLDCRRSAPYLLDTDPALDDPLFEASISQAYAENYLQQQKDADAHNAQSGVSERVIGGWLLAEEAATDIAAKFQSFAQRQLATQQLDWVRWTNPIYISVLWPTLSGAQKQQLLGDVVWLALDGSAQLRRYEVKDFAASDSAIWAQSSAYTACRLDEQQTRMLQNISLVRELLPGWQSLCEEAGDQLPLNAEQQLHAQVLAAQQAGLEIQSVPFYAMMAVQLKPGATEHTQWKKMVRHAAEQDLPLRDLIDQLPDEFWERYGQDRRESDY